VSDGGLPVNLDAERFVLGSIMIDDGLFSTASAVLEMEDFSLEKHRRIYARMLDLHGRGERIDRVTVANELMSHNQLESVDGLSYLISLDDGLPRTSNIDAYVRIVKEKAIARRLLFAVNKISAQCSNGDSTRKVLADAERILRELGDQAAVETGFQTPGEVVQNFPGGLNAFFAPHTDGAILTPWAELNEYTCGLRRGNLILLAARPSVGKTALALNVALGAAQKDYGVAFFSMEMSKEELVTRLACALGRVSAQDVRQGRLTSEDRSRLSKATNELAQIPLYFDDRTGHTVLEIESALRRLTARAKVDLVVVDYLQLMSGIGKSESRNTEVAAISRGLKLAAREFDVPFLVLSQLNRQVERRLKNERRPQMSDLRDSGALEADADLIMFLNRPETYMKDDPSVKGIAEVIIEKQRNGPTGLVTLYFRGEFGRFESMAYGDAQ